MLAWIYLPVCNKTAGVLLLLCLRLSKLTSVLVTKASLKVTMLGCLLRHCMPISFLRSSISATGQNLRAHLCTPTRVRHSGGREGETGSRRQETEQKKTTPSPHARQDST